MALGIVKLGSNLEDDQSKNLKEFYTEKKVFKLMMSQAVFNINMWIARRDLNVFYST